MAFNKIGIVFAPDFGKGKCSSFARMLKRQLEALDYDVLLCTAKTSYNGSNGILWLKTRDLIVAVGGDRTLTSLLPFLSKTAIPVYVVPNGGDSIFARNFGTSATIEGVLHDIDCRRVSYHCVPEIAGRPFFGMASIGLDSQLVHLIAKLRESAIGRWEYVLPVMKCCTEHSPAEITLRVDGLKKLDKARGYFIVANCSEYAKGLDLVPEADSSQENLVARFFPYDSKSLYLTWVRNAFLGQAVSLKNSLLFRGKEFAISVGNGDGFPVQVDGEHFGTTPVKVCGTGKRIVVLEGRDLRGLLRVNTALNF